MFVVLAASEPYPPAGIKPAQESSSTSELSSRYSGAADTGEPFVHMGASST
jgi:hypothetical protein